MLACARVCECVCVLLFSPCSNIIAHLLLADPPHLACLITSCSLPLQRELASVRHRQEQIERASLVCCCDVFATMTTWLPASPSSTLLNSSISLHFFSPLALDTCRRGCRAGGGIFYGALPLSGPPSRLYVTSCTLFLLLFFLSPAYLSCCRSTLTSSRLPHLPRAHSLRTSRQCFDPNRPTSASQDFLFYITCCASSLLLLL